jgi:cathepsin A (carboxypeptidase C)
MKDILILTVLLLAVLGEVPGDRVGQIPGMPAYNTFKVWSGYIDIIGDKHLHYMFLQSQKDPANDPVVIWFNGGPGCSSMLGFAQEHGPYLMLDGKETFEQTLNPYAWNTHSNILYIEAPAGVGYSWTGTENPEYTDDSAAEDNYQALKQFFTNMFAEYSEN